MSLLGDCVLWEEDLLRDHRTGYVHLQMIYNHFCSPETQNEKTVWERQSGCVSCFTFPLYAGKWSSSPWALFVQQLKRKHFMSLQRVNIWSYGLTKFQQSSWRKNRSHWFPLNKAVTPAAGCGSSSLWGCCWLPALPGAAALQYFIAVEMQTKCWESRSGQTLSWRSSSQALWSVSVLKRSVTLRRPVRYLKPGKQH